MNPPTMRPDELIAFIRRVAAENPGSRGTKILWSTHAIQKLVGEGLDRREVECALEVCELVESYPASHRPLPDCLALGLLHTGHPVHAVIGADVPQDRILVITTYRPSAERWEHDWKTRKS